MIKRNVLIIALSFTFTGTLALSRSEESPFDSDWTDGPPYSLVLDPKLNYQNAYWLAAISDFSYWHFRLVSPVYLTPKSKKTEVTFLESKKHPAIKESRTDKYGRFVESLPGFGFQKVKFFTSKIPKPFDKPYSNLLVRRWAVPLPLEACIVPSRMHCFAQGIPGSLGSGPNQPDAEEVAVCGKNLEKAYYSERQLAKVSAAQRKFLQVGDGEMSRQELAALNVAQNITDLVAKYEKKFIGTVNLDFAAPDFSHRCEVYRDTPKEVPDTQAQWLEDRDSIVVSFRGTESDSSEDIGTDLKSNLAGGFLDQGLAALKMSFADKRIHAGFYEALEIMHEGLFHEFQGVLEEQKRTGQRKAFFLTGHSLGGALAQLLGFFILKFNQQQGPDPLDQLKLTAIYTYGTPRIGQYSWVEDFNQMAQKQEVGNFRFVNHFDPVPHAPCGDFAHAGFPVYLDRHSAFIGGDIPVSAALDSCATGGDLLGNLFHLKSRINDHKMSSYYEALRPIFTRGLRAIEK